MSYEESLLFRAKQALQILITSPDAEHLIEALEAQAALDYVPPESK